MAIRYSLNELRNQPGRFVSHLHAGERFTYEHFLEYAEKVSTVARPDIVGVFSCAEQWLLNCAKAGKECDLGPLGRSRLGLKGVFDGRPQQILDKEVKLTLSWILPRELKDKVAVLGDHIERVQVIRKVKPPVISDVHGYVKTSQGWLVNKWEPGGLVHLKGDWLKFDPQQQDEGVFFQPGSGSKIIRSILYVRNARKNVWAVVPQELAGSGPLKVEIRGRTRPQDDRPKRGTYDPELEEAQ